MAGSQDERLKADLKQLIVHACNKDMDPTSIGDDDTLIGMRSKLGLDSLDVLQINVAIANRYGKRIEDGKHARRVMATVNSLADFVRPD